MGWYIFIYVVVYIIGICICGAICKHINEGKGYTGGFAWGFLGVVGIIVVACRSESPQTIAKAFYEQSKLVGNASDSQTAKKPSYHTAEEAWGYSRNTGKLNKNIEYWTCKKCGKKIPNYTAVCTCGTRRDENNPGNFAKKNRNSINSGEIAVKKNQTELGNIDLIIKYKELLDKGIITQEEFDEKKKQYLYANNESNVLNTSDIEKTQGWTCIKCGKSNPDERGTCYYCGNFRN